MPNKQTEEKRKVNNKKTIVLTIPTKKEECKDEIDKIFAPIFKKYLR